MSTVGDGAVVVMVVVVVVLGGGVVVVEGALIVSTTAFDVPPPLPEVKTVIWAVPATPIIELKIEACNCEALTYVVVRLEPFQRTTEPDV